MAAHVVNDHGESVITATDSLAPDWFDATTHAGDYHFDLPLTKLAAGDYLLTFEASADKTVIRRDVRFSVK